MSLDLFHVPEVDYRHEARRYVPFKLANTRRRPILFTVPASDDYYYMNDMNDIETPLNYTREEGKSFLASQG